MSKELAIRLSATLVSSFQSFSNSDGGIDENFMSEGILIRAALSLGDRSES